MTDEEAQHLLDRIGVLRRVCDLDLLIFFARHPRSLLTSESIASFLGYDLKEIADSLDVLLAGGLLTRAQSLAHAARLYVFAIDATDGGPKAEWLPSLLAEASTRRGRLALRDALKRRRNERPGSGTGPRQSNQSMPRSGPRHLIVQSKRRTATA